MASCHLYEITGVAAQLLYSLRRGDSLTAAQAAKELQVSEEQTLLFQLLTLAWLLRDPADNQAEIVAAINTKDVERLLFALITNPAPSSVSSSLPPLPSPSEIGPPPPGKKLPPPSWSVHPHGWTPHMAGALWWAVKGALTKRHFDRAYRLTQQLLEMPEPLNLLPFLASFGVPPALLDLLTQSSPALRHRVLLHSLAAAVGTATVGSAGPALPAAQARRAWSSTARRGGRRGRTFYVIADALAEWNVAPAPVTRLQGEPTLVAEDTASNYWTTVWSTGGGRVEEGCLRFNTDEQLESFYEKHFPDDIPDEWPSEERIKSHGQARHDAPKNVWRSAFLLCFASS